MVAPSAELKATLREWPRERTDALLAQRAVLLERQWVPPPPDPADEPIGEAGHCVQIPIKRVADALEAIQRDADRCTDEGAGGEERRRGGRERVVEEEEDVLGGGSLSVGRHAPKHAPFSDRLHAAPHARERL